MSGTSDFARKATTGMSDMLLVKGSIFRYACALQIVEMKERMGMAL
jgi:hypothetical protein